VPSGDGADFYGVMWPSVVGDASPVMAALAEGDYAVGISPVRFG
jgi:hypothetical protein